MEMIRTGLVTKKFDKNLETIPLSPNLSLGLVW
jgi:hypothetical protein